MAIRLIGGRLRPVGGQVRRRTPQAVSVAQSISPSTVNCAAGDTGKIATLVATGGAPTDYTYAMGTGAPAWLSIVNGNELHADGTQTATTVSVPIDVTNATGTATLNISLTVISPEALSFSFSPSSTSVTDDTTAGTVLAAGVTNGNGDGTLEVQVDPTGKAGVSTTSLTVGTTLDSDEQGTHVLSGRYYGDSAFPGEEVEWTFTLIVLDHLAGDDYSYGFFAPVPDETVAVVFDASNKPVVVSSTLPSIAVDDTYSNSKGLIAALDAAGGGWIQLPAGVVVSSFEVIGTSSIGLAGVPNEWGRPGTFVVPTSSSNVTAALRTTNPSTRFHIKHIRFGLTEEHILAYGPGKTDGSAKGYGDRGIRLLSTNGGYGQILTEYCTVWCFNKDGIEADSPGAQRKRVNTSFINRWMELCYNGIGGGLTHNTYIHNVGEFILEDSVSYNTDGHIVRTDCERAIIRRCTIKPDQGYTLSPPDNYAVMDLLLPGDISIRDCLVWYNHDHSTGPRAALNIRTRESAWHEGCKLGGGIAGWREQRGTVWVDAEDAVQTTALVSGAHSGGASTLAVKSTSYPVEANARWRSLDHVGEAGYYTVRVLLDNNTTHECTATLTAAGSKTATFDLAENLPSAVSADAFALVWPTAGGLTKPALSPQFYHKNNSRYIWDRIRDESGNLKHDHDQVYRSILDDTLFVSDVTILGGLHYCVRAFLDVLPERWLHKIEVQFPLPPLAPPDPSLWADDVANAGVWTHLNATDAPPYTLNLATLPTGFDGLFGSDYVYPSVTVFGDCGAVSIGVKPFTDLMDMTYPTPLLADGLHGAYGHGLQADGQVVQYGDATMAPRIQATVSVEATGTPGSLELSTTTGMQIGDKIQIPYEGYWISERLSKTIVQNGDGTWRLDPTPYLPSLHTTTIAGIAGTTVTLTDAVPGRVELGMVVCAFTPAASKPSWWDSVDNATIPNLDYSVEP